MKFSRNIVGKIFFYKRKKIVKINNCSNKTSLIESLVVKTRQTHIEKLVLRLKTFRISFVQFDENIF